MTRDSTTPFSSDTGRLQGTIGGCRIIRQLASGGMSHVYEALDEETRDRVALKLVLHQSGKDALEVLKAEREGAKLQERLCGSEPRVVRILRYGDEGDYFYVAMELVDGEDLSAYVERGRLNVPESLRIAIEVCEVLRSAHSHPGQVDGKNFHGIVHGDIKPHNIRLTSQAGVKVLDFGIAKALSLSRRLTSNEFGSLPYSSPERLEEGHVTEQSDLWSLGVVLYELLSGHPPFYADSSEKLETMIRMRRPPQPLTSCPPSLMRIVEKTLAPSLERRYADAKALLADLTAFRDGRPTLADQAVMDDSTQRVTAPRSSPEGKEETRRTFKAEARPRDEEPRPSTGASFLPGSPLAALKKVSPWRIIRWASFILIVAVLTRGSFALVEQWGIAKRARSLAGDLAATRVDREKVFDEHKQLARRALIPILVAPLRHELLASYLSVADPVIEEYRTSDAPLVRDKDWRRAGAAVARALELDPYDRKLRARQALIQAHLMRIGLVGRRLDQAQLHAAIRKFREASELTDWADPYLGLASLHAYVQHDVERTDAAVDQIAAHHLQPGQREQAQRADVRLLRASDMWKERRSIAHLPEEIQYVEKIRDHLSKAIELYGTILGFESAHANLRNAHRLLEVVSGRLAELDSARKLEEMSAPPAAPAPDETSDATPSGGA